MSENRAKYGSVRGLVVILGVVGLAVLATNVFAAAPGQAKKPAAAAKVAAPKTAEMFPHIDAALGYLKAADQELKGGEPKFYGHRINAIKHTEAAIADLQKGIDQYMASHPGTTRNQITPEAAPPPGAKFPHMEGALKLLQQAETHLNEAAKVYGGERGEGLRETRAAISEIQTGVKEAETKGK